MTYVVELKGFQCVSLNEEKDLPEFVLERYQSKKTTDKLLRSWRKIQINGGKPVFCGQSASFLFLLLGTILLALVTQKKRTSKD
eukprot:scaffold1356_cov123-Cylindrotheca_fusiformis.AAC.6